MHRIKIFLGTNSVYVYERNMEEEVEEKIVKPFAFYVYVAKVIFISYFEDYKSKNRFKTERERVKISYLRKKIMQKKVCYELFFVPIRRDAFLLVIKCFLVPRKYIICLNTVLYIACSDAKVPKIRLIQLRMENHQIDLCRYSAISLFYHKDM